MWRLLAVVKARKPELFPTTPGVVAEPDVDDALVARVLPETLKPTAILWWSWMDRRPTVSNRPKPCLGTSVNFFTVFTRIAQFWLWHLVASCDGL